MIALVNSKTCQFSPNCAAGFTLVEALVTLAVAAVLTAIAVPNFQQFVQRLAIDSERIELQNMMMLARSEAVKRSQQVWITSSQGSWRGDLVAFVDLNDDFVRQENEPIIAQVGQQKQIMIEPGTSVTSGLGYTAIGNSYAKNTNDSSAVAGNGNLALRSRANSDSYVGTFCIGVNGRTNLLVPKTASAEKISCS
jgi:type IV fimbrial biogenesis protein FimT